MPFSSAPQISKVAASNDGDPVSNIREPGSKSAYKGFITSRTTFLCPIMTPFGVPVEPEVYIM
ncbi:hypothetical protein D3C74_326010 [compost metagenome]